MARALVALASILVPRLRRKAWVEEWSSEVWHYVRMRESGEYIEIGSGLKLVARCMGAFPHALWIRGEEWSMDTVVQDIRYAFRTLIKRPLFALITVATLTVGIGGSTAIFSIVDSVLLNPLRMEDSDRVMYVWGTVSNGAPTSRVSPPDFRDFVTQNTVFETLGAFRSASLTLTGSDRAQEMSVMRATANLLEVLGFSPTLGRGFTADEEVDAGDAVMISHELWQRRFGGSADALGRSMVLDGAPMTIVGVLPEGLDFPAVSDLWVPLTVQSPDWDSRGSHFLRVVGRLRPGVTESEAQAELDVISRRLEEAYPETNAGFYAQVQPLQDVLVGAARPGLLTLLGAVGLVLLIACGNVANLLLARAADRRGEVALRSAVGASRVRILRQLITESLILAFCGGLAGLGLGFGTVRVLQAVRPQNLPRVDEIAIDGSVLAFAIVVSTLVGLLFGLAPALKLSGASLINSLKTARGDRGGSTGRLRNALVTFEVALSLVLLVGASLLVKSLVQLQAVDPGIDPEGVVTVSVNLPTSRYEESAEVRVAFDEMIEGLAELPGAHSASAVSLLPFSGNGGDTYVYAEGRRPEHLLDVGNTALIHQTAEGYFRTMRIPMLSGRGFMRSDSGADEAPLVAVVSEPLAARLWPSEAAVGEQLLVWLGEGNEIPFEVIGVAQNVEHFGLGSGSNPAFYVAQRQFLSRSMNLVVRGSGDLGELSEAVREAIWAVDADQTLARMTTMERLVANSTARSRFQSSLMGSFAALAMILAAMGVYGVLAYSVIQRRHELGIRMAMGADRGTVTRMVLRSGARLSGAGILLGLIGAFALSRLMGGLLFQVEPNDPMSFALPPAILAGVALMSSYLPARRAATVDPSTALREDEG